ncbi:HAT, C-terminal dimerization domain containing protein, partial [Trema orientale]
LLFFYHTVDWWDQFGDEVPELKAFAIRVLGLTCSSSACERNWSTFNQVHTKRRNRLTMSRMNTLVYIMYNKKLKHKFLKAKSRKEEDDPLIVENVSSDDEWVANLNDEDDEETRMIDLNEAIDVEDVGGSS